MARTQHGVSLPPEMWTWLYENYENMGYRSVSLLIEDAILNFMENAKVDKKTLENLKTYKKIGKDAQWIGDLRFAVLNAKKNMERDLEAVNDLEDVSWDEKEKLRKRITKRYERVKNAQLIKIGVREKAKKKRGKN